MESIPMARYSYIIAFAVLLIFAGGAFADSMTFTNPGSNVWQGVYVNVYWVGYYRPYNLDAVL
jgi:hypothetical protein